MLRISVQAEFKCGDVTVSERGVFAVDRGIWDHDLLADSGPLSRREAWLWLISEAAWKPHRRRLAGKTVEVGRGQIAASLRFIASKWRWSEPRVRRFLSALKNERMIDAKTDAGISLITICKYDDYQRVSLPDDATNDSGSDAGATQERRKVEGKEDKESNSGGSALAELARVLSEDRAKAVIEHRKKLKKPLTVHAARLIAGKFAQVPDPNAAADAMIANGWQGFEPSWLENRGRQNGNGNRNSSTGKSDWAATLERAGDYVAASRGRAEAVPKDDGTHRH